MQKQNNELETLISEAFRRGSPAYLAPILSIIYNKVDVQNFFLQKIDMEKLNRLSYKADSVSTYYIVGLTYDLILSSRLIDVEAIASDLLLAIANSLLPVLDNIKGTSLSYRIVQYIQILFYIILQRKELSEEDHSLIESLLQGENLKVNKVFFKFEENEDVHEIVQLGKSKSVQDKVASIIKLMDLLTYCTSFEEQIEIFAKKTLDILKLVLNGTNETYIELFEVLGTFLETMLFQFQHNIRFEKKLFELETNFEKNMSSFIHLVVDESNKQLDANEVLETINKEFSPRSIPKIVVQYILEEQVKTVRETEGIYTVVSLILNIFTLYPKFIELQLVSIRVLERLYYHFPAHRKNMEESIMMLFSNINAETSEEIRKPAAIFLYKLTHGDASPSFKAELEKRESIKPLFSSTHYNSAVLTVERNEAEIIDFQDLHIRVGSPLNRTIEAGMIRSEYVEVLQPYSILTFSFAVLQYDLLFSIERIARFKNILKYEKDEPFTILKNGRIDSSKNPICGSILIKEPGIYRIDFNNKNSWFNSKTVRFRVLVLSPNFEDSFELKTRQKLIYEATLGQILLPSTIFANDAQPTLDSPRERLGTHSSIIMPQKRLENIRALIYLNSKSVEFSVVSTGKEFEIILNYDESKIDWEKINSRMLNVIDKVFDSNNDQNERKIDMQLVYDESVLEKQLNQDKLDENFPERVRDYFFKNLSLLAKIKKLLKDGQIQIISEIEFQAHRLLNDASGLAFKTMVLFIIDHATKEIYCKLRKETRQVLDIILEDYAIPVSRPSDQGGEEIIELRSADMLFFAEGQSVRKRLGYLAFLMHSIFCSSNRSIRNYAIIEDIPILFGPKSNNRAIINEMLQSYYEKFKRAEDQGHSMESNDYSLNLHFCDENKDTNVKL